jgi:hypothetical protein
VKLLPRIWISKLAESDLDSFQRELERLSLLSLEEARNLPEYQELEETMAQKGRTLGLYAIRNWENGTVKVVLQNYRHWFLGIGSMVADGFVFEADGRVIPLPEEELWEYM